MKYLSIQAQPRTQRAILDEWLPRWRFYVTQGGPMFIDAWMQATDMPESSAWRWHRIARDLLANALKAA